jgi:hypothetical protein
MRRMKHIAYVKDFEKEKLANNIRTGGKMN